MFSDYVKRFWRLLWKTALIGLVLSLVFVITFRFVPVPFTPLMINQSVVQLFNKEKIVFEKDWVPITDISPSLALAVICSEDQKFKEHNGFDMEAIKKALKNNKKGKKIKGASTISQQVAKNVFLWESRTWIRKGFEVYFTFLIELFWSKERIMEVYLNVIEMGKGIYGAQAASKQFFKKDAAQLNASEAALIAAVLPNPRKWSAKKPSAYIYKRQRWILNQMNNWGNKIDIIEEEPEEEK